MSEGQAMARAINNCQLAFVHDFGQFLCSFQAHDSVLPAMEQEGGRQIGAARLVDSALVEQNQILSQLGRVHGPFMNWPVRTGAVAIEITDQAVGIGLHPHQHLLDMFTGEAASGRGRAVEMGKAADDNKQSCSGQKLLGDKVESQGVADQHETGLICAAVQLAGITPIAAITKAIRRCQYVLPIPPALTAKAPAMLKEEIRVRGWAVS